MPKVKKSKKKPVKKALKKTTKKAKQKSAPTRKGGNPHLAKLKRKAEKLKQHLKSAGEDKQSLVRLKQIETQIAG